MDSFMKFAVKDVKWN